MVAVLQAVVSIPREKELTILTDSKWTIHELTKHRQKREDNGYIGTANAALAKATVAKLRERDTPTRIKWVKGHDGNILNEGADGLAAQGAGKADEDAIDLTVPVTLRVTGAKLKSMTQKLAYQAIREKKTSMYKKRPRTEANITLAKAAAEANFKVHLTEARIWKSMANKDLHRNQRIFMWMLAHDGYMVGDKWLRQNFREELQLRATCKQCDTLDSMDHILSQF
jgi:hypothetical protein